MLMSGVVRHRGRNVVAVSAIPVMVVGKAGSIAAIGCTDVLCNHGETGLTDGQDARIDILERVVLFLAPPCPQPSN